jgi:hypothetical protein
MFERIYFSLWGLTFLAGGVLYLLGEFTTLTGVVLGFVFFGLTFMGMIGVLPNWVGHQVHPKH